MNLRGVSSHLRPRGALGWRRPVPTKNVTRARPAVLLGTDIVCNDRCADEGSAEGAALCGDPEVSRFVDTLRPAPPEAFEVPPLLDLRRHLGSCLPEP